MLQVSRLLQSSRERLSPKFFKKDEWTLQYSNGKNVKAEYFSKHAKGLFKQMFYAFQDTVTLSSFNLFKANSKCRLLFSYFKVIS